MIDVMRLVYEVLVGDAALVSATGGKIYGPPGLPVGFEIGPAVVFYGNGGDSSAYIPEGTALVVFRCYGKTAAEARKVYGALHDALNRRRTSVTVGTETWVLDYALLASGPYDMVEPDLGWHFVHAMFTLRVTEVPVI